MALNPNWVHCLTATWQINPQECVLTIETNLAWWINQTINVMHKCKPSHHHSQQHPQGCAHCMPKVDSNEARWFHRSFFHFRMTEASQLLCSTTNTTLIMPRGLRTLDRRMMGNVSSELDKSRHALETVCKLCPVLGWTQNLGMPTTERQMSILQRATVQPIATFEPNSNESVFHWCLLAQNQRCQIRWQSSGGLCRLHDIVAQCTSNVSSLTCSLIVNSKKDECTLCTCQHACSHAGTCILTTKPKFWRCSLALFPHLSHVHQTCSEVSLWWHNSCHNPMDKKECLQCAMIGCQNVEWMGMSCQIDSFWSCQSLSWSLRLNWSSICFCQFCCADKCRHTIKCLEKQWSKVDPFSRHKKGKGLRVSTQMLDTKLCCWGWTVTWNLNWQVATVHLKISDPDCHWFQTIAEQFHMQHFVVDPMHFLFTSSQISP